MNDLGDSLTEIDSTLQGPPGHRWMKTHPFDKIRQCFYKQKQLETNEILLPV